VRSGSARERGLAILSAVKSPRPVARRPVGAVMRRSDVRSICCIALGIFTISAVADAQERCKPLTEAKKLPALAMLLDSGGVVTNLPAPDSSGPAEVLMSVTTGATPRAFVMDSLAAKTSAAKAVLERVLSSLKCRTKSEHH